MSGEMLKPKEEYEVTLEELLLMSEDDNEGARERLMFDGEMFPEYVELEQLSPEELRGWWRGLLVAPVEGSEELSGIGLTQFGNMARWAREEMTTKARERRLGFDEKTFG